MKSVIHTFYEAFQRKDAATMRACYRPDASFTDPAFGSLVGKDIGDMWAMLCENGKDLIIEYKVLEVTDTQGKVQWEARYSFGPSKRKVHNIVSAHFVIEGGKISTHRDDFDFHRWASQALGVLGKLLGRYQWFNRKFQQQAKQLLQRFQVKNNCLSVKIH